jgi:hypothetical protein
MGASRAPVTAVAAVVGGVLLVAVLVTWAASIGPGGVLTGEGPATHRATATATTSDPTDPFSRLQAENNARQGPQAGDHPILRAFALALEVLAATAVLYVLWRGGRSAYQAWDARRRPPREPDEVDFEVLEEAQRALTEQMGRDAAQQREILLGGRPRNAIVECWHRFEQQAADAGLARHPWETSSEFTLRMLDLVEADSHAVAELAVLYREARFSEHDLDEAARSDALDALDVVHRGLLGRAR